MEPIGISRPMLNKYMDAGKLELIRNGLYVLAGGIADEFALLQAQSSKAIYSYGTAVYFWGLFDRTPDIYDLVSQRRNLRKEQRSVYMIKRDVSVI